MRENLFYVVLFWVCGICRCRKKLNFKIQRLAVTDAPQIPFKCFKKARGIRKRFWPKQWPNQFLA